MRKLLAALLAATLLMASAFAPAAAANTVPCGSSIGTPGVYQNPDQPELSPEPEETPPPENTPAPQETPEPDETPAPENTPVPEDSPTPENTPKPEDTPAPENTPKPEDTPEPEETPEPDPTPTPEPLLPGLEKEDHRPYLSGDQDKVSPNGRLTRAEAASILYSLLEFRPERTGMASFPDVSENAWYAPQVLTLAELGVLSGNDRGMFQPTRAITRREFVVVLSHFFPEGSENPGPTFPDVTDSMWGSGAINTAAALGWISGGQDGTFQPDRSITRAEATIIVNNALGRKPDPNKLKEDGNVLVFVDLAYTHWAYASIMEAALVHEHSEDGSSWVSYEIPTAAHKPGTHLISGELYLVDDSGHFARNKTVGVLRFGNDGRYTTGNPRLDQELTAFVKQNTKEGDSQYNNYKRLHDLISTWPYRAGSYLGAGTETGQTGWEPAMALDMLANRKGNCYRYAGLGTMLARKLGYQANGVSGFVDIGYDFVLHGWVEIELDGQILICDPQQQFRFPQYDFYMKKYSELASHHKYKVKDTVKK